MIPLEKAFAKACRYCAYQERSHYEVREKLYGWGLWKKDVEEILSRLITEGFLNEERFAIAFAGGKFRMKKWGRIRIAAELKKRKVSEYCIRRALEEIPEGDYSKTLNEVIRKKSGKELPHDRATLSSVARYAVSRGFEPELVWEALKAE